MQFGAFMRDEAKDRGSDALQVELSFNQKNILEVRSKSYLDSLCHYISFICSVTWSLFNFNKEACPCSLSLSNSPISVFPPYEILGEWGVHQVCIGHARGSCCQHGRRTTRRGQKESWSGRSWKTLVSLLCCKVKDSNQLSQNCFLLLFFCFKSPFLRILDDNFRKQKTRIQF